MLLHQDRSGMVLMTVYTPIDIFSNRGILRCIEVEVAFCRNDLISVHIDSVCHLSPFL